eukprot:12745867-Alexandrium_andersonii.AAC.1
MSGETVVNDGKLLEVARPRLCCSRVVAVAKMVPGGTHCWAVRTKGPRAEPSSRALERPWGHLRWPRAPRAGAQFSWARLNVVQQEAKHRR